MQRRDFVRSTLGALASLPFLRGLEGGQGNRLVRGKFKAMKINWPKPIAARPLILRQISMNPDIGIVGGSPLSMSQLQTAQVDMSQPMAGFGVILYLDPRGLFMEKDTDADI